MQKFQIVSDKSVKISHPFNKILCIARCCALLPIKRTKTNFYFTWRSLHVVFTLTVLTSLLILFLFEIMYCGQHELDARRITSLLSKLCVILILLGHVRLARRCPTFMQDWYQSEIIMESRYGVLERISLRLSLVLSIFFISVFGVIVMSFIFQFRKFEVLKLDFYAYIFEFLPFNYGFTTFFAVVYFVYFLCLNFNDVFIIVLSMFMAMRFKQIRNRLECMEAGKEFYRVSTSLEFWSEMRRDYDRLSHLCLKLNEEINGLILVSFSYNLYFIISYIFHYLIAEEEPLHIRLTFYMLFSVTSLRMFGVCVYASWINDESLGPVNVLNSVCSKIYNAQIERWVLQLSYDKVALTGGNIFKITRGIFINVISIVVTYELVVMQFYGFSTQNKM